MTCAAQNRDGVWASGWSSWRPGLLPPEEDVTFRLYNNSSSSTESSRAENQGKIIGTNIGIIIAIFGQFMGEMCLNNRFKSFLELMRFRLVQSNLDVII